MKNSKVGDSHDAIKQTSSLLPWRVIHLPYPRETEKYSSLKLKWIPCWKIKLPKIFIQKKTLEKQGLSVNYDLLCQQIESVLNRQAAEGYKLISIHSTHSGSYSVTSVPKQPHYHFLKTRAPSHHLQGKEALILILKQKKSFQGPSLDHSLPGVVE